MIPLLIYPSTEFILMSGGYIHMIQLPGDQHITYQLQFRKCGKPTCRTCREGQGHGPYWYAYWREGSRLRSGYIGKESLSDSFLHACGAHTLECGRCVRP